ncbi:MAG: hypothetical protein P8J87_14495, partial [Verrucomicrobiales bacterium]|nr:hypothetical protein [Verrucomicrobiales bacterium]
MLVLGRVAAGVEGLGDACEAGAGWGRFCWADAGDWVGAGFGGGEGECERGDLPSLSTWFAGDHVSIPGVQMGVVGGSCPV